MKEFALQIQDLPSCTTCY